MAAPLPGPVKLRPRLDAKIWGGRRLTEFGLHLPDTQLYGEALLTSPDTVVQNGPWTGRTLAELIASDPVGLLGETGCDLAGADNVFPLLIKLIDASDVLSIQVHPNDDQAPVGSRGKTEAWYVLDAEPGAVLYVGLDDPDAFADIAAASRHGDSIGDQMRVLPVRAGDALFIPAGTIHAIGAGILLYEIQQPSAITYRFDDWGRVDADGQARKLHIEEAIAVSDPQSRPEIRRPVVRRSTDPAQPFITCREFGIEVIGLEPLEGMTFLPEAGVSAITCVSGRVVIAQDGESVPVGLGETVVFLGGHREIAIRSYSASQLLHGWIGPG